MKISKKILGIVLVVLVIIFGAYSLYPRSGSFNDLILTKYSKVEFKKVILTSTKHGSFSASSNNIDKINKVLPYLGELKLIEYKSKKDEHYTYNEYYDIGLYDHNNNVLGISVYNENLIQVYIGMDSRTKIYRITDNKVDIEHIKKLIQD